VLVGTVRTTEKLQATVEGHLLDELREAAAGVTPDGFELVSIQPKMSKGSALLTGEVVARRNELSQIEADSMGALRAIVPEGWQLIAVRSV